MPWQAAAIAGGAQLLGGLLSKPKKVQQNFREERQNLKNIVQGAREAGFNPLTVLRATGGQPTANAIQSPLGARAAVGEAIKTFGGTYAQDAIQRATEERAQDDWKERFDYAQAARNVPQLSAKTGENQRLADEAAGRVPQGFGERTFQDGSGRFPRVNPHGIRPEEAMIGSGPYKDRYVISTTLGYFLTPKGMAPSAITEETIGDLATEIVSLSSLGGGALKEKGFEQVHWNSDTGEVTGVKPQGAMRTQSTPVVPRDPAFLGKVGRQLEPTAPFLPYNAWHPALRLQ